MGLISKLNRMKPVKGILVVVVCLALTGIALVVIGTTVLTASEGGFEPREVLSERSADGSLRVVVTKRFAFPAYDLVDPSVVIRAELHDTATDEIVASDRVVLIEDSQFGPAAVQWYPGEVRITGFDSRSDQVMILRDVRKRAPSRRP